MKALVSPLLFLSCVIGIPSVSQGQLFFRGLRGPDRVASRPESTGPKFTEAPATSGIGLSSGVVPGTGVLLEKAFDDFEDEEWSFDYKLPKASHEQDNQRRYPLGGSANGHWQESAKRGTPDHVVRVATPPGGLPDSKGAMKIQTLNSGIPGITTYEPQQDDLILNVGQRYGRISIGRIPNVVVRVWMPPFEEWEARSGSHFGVRMALGTTTTTQERRFLFKRTVEEAESYWPGFFVQYTRKADGHPEDSAMFLIRGANNGGDFPGPRITQTGWWTLGMTANPNGSVSYYASPGVEPLTAADHIATTLPYNYQAQNFSTLFFNITSANNGSTWSTPFIVDDPMVFTAR